MKLKEIAELKRQLAVEKNKERIIQIQKAISRMESDIQIAKEKMKHLLKGAADTVSKAAASLGMKTSNALSKLSSDILSYKPQATTKPSAPAPDTFSMDENKPFAPSIPPPYSFKGKSRPSKKYERRIEKRFSVSPSKINLSMTGESED